MTPAELRQKCEEILKEPFERLYRVVMDAAQESGVIPDPIDYLTSCLIVMAVGMLRGYRPEENAVVLRRRVDEAVTEGLNAAERVEGEK